MSITSNSTRRERFRKKIELERAFLSVINQKFGEKLPLTGMTESAIFSWKKQAIDFFPDKNIEEITKIVTEASARFDLLADNSHDVFESKERPKIDSLNDLLDILRNAVLA